MKRLGIVAVFLLYATPVLAEFDGLTKVQGQCVLDHIDAARSSQGARDIVVACVDYRMKNPKLFNCIIKQQVKADSDTAARAVRDACTAVHK
jgi:hypothetical protein